MEPLRRVAGLAILSAIFVAAGPGATGQPPSITGEVATYVIERGDTLRLIGARFAVDVETLRLDNQLAANAKLSIGQPLHVDNRHIVPSGLVPGAIVINVPQRMLFYAADDESTAAFPVAVGRRDWQTPIAAFTIVQKEKNPTWDVPASILAEARRAGRELPAKVPPGPANPLGQYWLGLSISAVGIHGTNAPSSIYGAVTHGCIRLRSEDIAWLFDRVSVRTPGRVVYEPVLLTVVGDEVFLEAHHDIYRRAPRDSREVVRQLAETAGVADRIDWALAHGTLEARAGIARAISAGKNPRPGETFGRGSIIDRLNRPHFPGFVVQPRGLEVE